MNSLRRKGPLILLFGDIFFFILSLFVALAIRNLEVPSKEVLLSHLGPFGLIFIIWVSVFYVAGLYEKQTLILRSRLPGLLFNTQIVNSGLAVLFFYLVPYFGITPKTVLFIYLIISFGVVLFWRAYLYFLLGNRTPINAVIIGGGEEMKGLFEEINNQPLYNIHFVSSVDLDKTRDKNVLDEIVSTVYSEDVSLVVIDLNHPEVEPVLPYFYKLIFSNINFVDMHKMYEDIFDRVPLSLIKYNWFLENVSTSPRVAYDMLKRMMDVSISLVLGILSLIIYPFVFIAIKLDDGGDLFSFQNRVGQNNKIVKIIKFRTMTKANDDGKWGGVENKVTRVGAFLRNSRIDELPQLWNVIVGNISLIGPRPEFPDPVKQYMGEIPFYNVRHIIKPGLSGWAQIYHEGHPHHSIDILETKNKLSYDLYYIKNRSFLLDLRIALRTVRTLLSRAGK
ncbi:MAG: putative colanic acid biosysnthesis UDP-glucose lipid carrier transferase [Parcubacteria bacterium C7867-005]|nr:MAG: putative colanic acid biosysnthesis UDP-glucose lipid carrier transferase [Parcubacteria bacterium C7867-005]